MTLAQMATYITAKMSDTDTASVTICQNFLNQAFQNIWESYIWDETLGIATASVNAGDTVITLSNPATITYFQNNAPGNIYVDFPVAIKYTRTGDTLAYEMTGFDWMHFFQLDPNVWENISGRNARPQNFINIPKDANGYCRLKPVAVPDVGGTLYVLGKLQWTALAATDSPSLRGVTNALLAYGEGYMLERARQYGKAQTKFAEAAAHVQTMIDIEGGQKQRRTTIVPDQEANTSPIAPDGGWRYT